MGAINFSLDKKIVQVLKSALNLDLFIETGTFKGDNLKEVEKFFEKIISIEVSKRG